jgi:error-prone DNA polymerase
MHHDQAIPLQQPPPAYAELHCLSNFSFLRGASHPEELIERAHTLGYAALALTDECSLAGVVRAHLAARRHAFKLIVGSTFTLTDGARLVLLAPEREAYGDLSELITHARRTAGKGTYRITRADVARHAGRCLALWLPGEAPDIDTARWVAGTFPGRGWIAVESGPAYRRRACGSAPTGSGACAAAGGSPDSIPPG